MTVSAPSPTRPKGRPTPAVRFGSRSTFLLLLTTLFGVAAFGWPLLVHGAAGQNGAHSGDAPWVFVGLLPLLLAIVMAELSEGAIDAKSVALLGILAACFAALRVASPGINGFEPEWFLLILAARVFGRGFGFVLGAVAFFASALVTGGVGPWLPFQMLAAGWVAFGAACLPPMRGLPERLLLAGVRRGVRAPLRVDHRLLVLALRGVDDHLLIHAGTRDIGQSAPVPPFRTGDRNGVQPDPRRDVRRLDPRARPTRAGGVTASVPASRF